jgi:UDP-glucose 4-epimerase
MVTDLKKPKEQVEFLNLGARDQISVMRIADVVCEEMGLKNVKVRCKKVTADGRGWIGDVKFMRLDVSKLEGIGWRPTMNSETAVRSATKATISELAMPAGKASRVPRLRWGVPVQDGNLMVT